MFKRCKNIKAFLLEKALRCIKRRRRSVYLILDEEAFAAGVLRIEEYFTPSYKSLIPEAAPKSKVRDTVGFKETGFVHFVLMGQTREIHRGTAWRQRGFRKYTLRRDTVGLCF